MDPQDIDALKWSHGPLPYPMHLDPRGDIPPHTVYIEKPGKRITVSQPGGNRDNVIACRVDDEALAAIDALVEAGISSTRSEAAAWLIKAGIGAQQNLLQEINGTVAEIRRLREEAKAKAQGGQPATQQEQSS